MNDKIYKPWGAGKEWGVELFDEEYKGVVISFTQLEFKENDRVDVEFHVISRPEHLPESFEKNDSFSVVLERVINDILTEALRDEENRKNNSEKPGT